MADTARDVFQAFKTFWDSKAALTAALQGPFRNRADGHSKPYVIFDSISNRRSERTSSSEYWEHTFQLVVYNTTAALVESNAALMADYIDGAALTLSSGQVVYCDRVGEVYGQDDKRVEYAILEYALLRKKPR